MTVDDLTIAVEYQLNKKFQTFMKHAAMCLTKKNTVESQLGRSEANYKKKGT